MIMDLSSVARLEDALRTRFPGERVGHLAEAWERGEVRYGTLGAGRLRPGGGTMGAGDGKVSPHDLLSAIAELGLDVEINQTIAEFKGAGMMSPSLRRAPSSGTVEYELNPSL